jgi:hypothetical protein
MPEQMRSHFQGTITESLHSLPNMADLGQNAPTSPRTILTMGYDPDNPQYLYSTMVTEVSSELVLPDRTIFTRTEQSMALDRPLTKQSLMASKKQANCHLARIHPPPGACLLCTNLPPKKPKNTMRYHALPLTQGPPSLMQLALLPVMGSPLSLPAKGAQNDNE